MVATTRLQRWLAPRIASREADTERFIADSPTTVSVKRTGALLTVRIVPLAMRGQEVRGQASESNNAPVTIVAMPGTDLKADDRLQAPGGVVYKVGYVQPGQSWRVEAAAEVLA